MAKMTLEIEDDSASNSKNPASITTCSACAWSAGVRAVQQGGQGHAIAGVYGINTCGFGTDGGTSIAFHGRAGKKEKPQ